MIGRRGLIGGLIALAAPAIIHPGVLMPILRRPKLVMVNIHVNDGDVQRAVDQIQREMAAAMQIPPRILFCDAAPPQWFLDQVAQTVIRTLSFEIVPV